MFCFSAFWILSIWSSFIYRSLQMIRAIQVSVKRLVTRQTSNYFLNLEQCSCQLEALLNVAQPRSVGLRIYHLNALKLFAYRTKHFSKLAKSKKSRSNKGVTVDFRVVCSSGVGDKRQKWWPFSGTLYLKPLYRPLEVFYPLGKKTTVTSLISKKSETNLWCADPYSCSYSGYQMHWVP